MYGPFAMEMARIRIDTLHAEARRRKPDRPARWRRATGRALIAAGARLSSVCVRTVPAEAQRGTRLIPGRREPRTGVREWSRLHWAPWVKTGVRAPTSRGPAAPAP